MGLLIATALLIFWTAAPGTAALSPHTLFEAGFLQDRPPPCQEVPWHKLQTPGGDWKGKAATWTMNGEKRCDRTIFEYGERPAFANFALEQSMRKAQSIALKLASDISQENPMNWVIEVKGLEPGVASRVEQIFRHEISMIVGDHTVLRRAPANSPYSILTIDVKQSQDPEFLFLIYSQIPGQKDKIL